MAEKRVAYLKALGDAWVVCQDALEKARAALEKAKAEALAIYEKDYLASIKATERSRGISPEQRKEDSMTKNERVEYEGRRDKMLPCMKCGRLYDFVARWNTGAGAVCSEKCSQDLSALPLEEQVMKVTQYLKTLFGGLV